MVERRVSRAHGVRGALLALLSAATPAAAQNTYRPIPTAPAARPAVVEARRTSERIRLDAVLSESIWRTSDVIPLPFEVHPGNNTPAPVATECRVAYDDANLYFACHAFDREARSIRAVRTDRDNVADQDRVGITIDPFSDRRRAWEFGVTPLGVQYDAVYDQQDDQPDDSWSTIWTSVGRIVDDGYIVEAAIPFKSLRFPPSRGAQSWGFFAWRQWPRHADVALRSIPIDPANRCLLCQAATLTGLREITPGRNVELTPTITGIRTDERTSGGSGLTRGDARPELGADARWSITPDLTVNATANPDFSQVEADVAALDANLLFALSFPERRPFFLEGSDLFSSPQNVVFTRSIADPSAGAKMSGKHGSNAFGVLAARDEVTNLLIPGHESSTQTSIDRRTSVVVARYRRDVGVSSTIGVVGTGREADAYANRVVGVDALLRPRPTMTVSAQYLYSSTRYPDSLATSFAQRTGTFGGALFGARALYQTRATQFRALVWNYDRDFRADAGFIGQVGVVEGELDYDRWFWGKPREWYTRAALGSGYYFDVHDTTPGYTNSWRFLRLTYEGPRQTSVRFYARMRHEVFRGTAFDYWTPWVGLSVRPTNAVALSADATFGGEIDYAAGRLARTVRLSPRVSVRAGRSAELELRHSLLRLTSGDRTLLSADLTELRARHHLTHRLFIRGIVQHRASERTAASASVVEPDRTKSLYSQFLIAYRVDAQTAALFGYGDTRRADAIDPALPGDDELTSLRPVNRTFFVKVSYAWRP